MAGLLEPTDSGPGKKEGSGRERQMEDALGNGVTSPSRLGCKMNRFQCVL